MAFFLDWCKVEVGLGFPIATTKYQETQAQIQSTKWQRTRGVFMKTLFIRTLVYDNLLAYVNMSQINLIKYMIVLTSVCRFYSFQPTTLVIIPVPSLYLNVIFGIRRFHTQVKGPQGHQCSQLHLHRHPKGTAKRMPATKKDGRRHGDPCWGRPLLDK
jgi:FlaA1/EpsC-like NDP-sugar epimerase